MKALIIGATGATGKDLTNILLQNPAYTEVVIFVRRSAGISHPRLTEIMTDFDKLEDVADAIRGDVWFNCMGSTLKTAGSKEKQWHIDYEIPLKFAEIAKRNGVPKAVLVSAFGASPRSKIFYSNMKGKLEEDVSKLAFDQCVIFKPGMLLRKDTDRAGEHVFAAILKFLNRIGLLRKHRPLDTYILAEKLAKAPGVLPAGKHVISLDKIFDF
ncbi:NAD(P)H-binding protein [Chitinophaga pinensis]|uniref:Semialdehyde dehydrogenase NAD-binding n=1 Tax=Chitinophaga pinensis (strain ATCC 43595 / DSM 2588 / LMG 13176 / NBRC 15968 / NCIMB 11800 / UQM 2034) TaxID=485918 RepID=A0A979GBA7_CHIPD|nr:NAD(P)H-binding protein [Chitinophaga pinensis]ACU64052.1 Semialdehyde dehydrogenase NAD - binding [Chitinophaga pinensis DSM 2588]